MNRIIEIECKDKLFADAPGLLDVVRANYGHAGKLFMGFMATEEAKEKALVLYKHFYRELGTGSTEKQTMAAAVILTADALATEWLFCDGRALSTSDIDQYLHSRESVDVGARGFDYIQDFCISNQGRFDRNAEVCYGAIVGDEVRIIRGVFDKICEDGGFNSKALLSWMDRKGRLIKDPKGNLYKSVKVNGKAARCACINLGEAEEQAEFIPAKPSEIPFR